MKIFSTVRKNLKNWIFTEEFDREYQDETARVIFVMHCLMGGFCYHDHVQTNFRKLWITFNMFNFFLVYVSFFIYWINIPKENYYLLTLPVPVMLGLLIKVIIYISTYLMKDALTKIIAFLNRKNRILDSNLSNLDPSTPQKIKYGSISAITTAAFGCFLLLIVTSMAVNFGIFVKYDDYIVYLYPMYAPFNKPTYLRFAVKVIQTATVLPEYIIIVTNPILIFTIVVNIYDRFVSLSLYLRDASQSLQQIIDEVFNLELAMEEKQIPSSLSKIDEMKIKKALALDEFNGKIIQVAKLHQELYPIAKLYAGKMDFMYSLFYTYITTSTIVGTFFIAAIPEMKIQLHEFMAVVVGVLLLLFTWLMLCFIGEIFQKMNKIIASEVYNSPWYYLEAKDRRLVLTFLTITQRQIAVVVCGIFSAGLFSFPDLLYSIYNQATFLRTLELNK